MVAKEPTRSRTWRYGDSKSRSVRTWITAARRVPVEDEAFERRTSMRCALQVDEIEPGPPVRLGERDAVREHADAADAARVRALPVPRAPKRGS